MESGAIFEEKSIYIERYVIPNQLVINNIPSTLGDS